MQFRTQLFAATVLAMTWQPSGIAVNAQTPSSPSDQSPTTGLAQPSEKIPDHKLDAAAAILQRVAKLQEDFHQQMERVAEKAKEQAEKAITEQGLSVEEYTSILETAQKDPDVREKLLARIPPPQGGDDKSAPRDQNK